jgi:glycosyltransferase involved in cell wall biosynthesis
MKIAFHSNQLGIRGTEVALYDYALGNRDILGNESIIISDVNADLATLDKFKSQFPVYLYNNFSEVEVIVEQERIDAIYYIKAGFNDGKLVNNAKNLIHTVFKHKEPHGDVYSYISEWLSNEISNNELPYVPHMVNLPKHSLNYKDNFNVEDKIVIGWYGGDNFEIPFARQAVIDIAKKRKDILFLFMNQTSFCDLDNVIFIEGTTDLDEKVAFINTCDFMIHARERGETFGLTIAEFSTLGKPIITYRDSPELNHINILGDRGIYYSNYNDLYQILDNISKQDIEGKDWNCYKEFTPEKVMNKFKKVFLDV